MMTDEEAQLYAMVGFGLGGLAWIVVFLSGWIYSSLTYGFLWGFGLGWLPSLIAATILAVLMRYIWPFFVLLACLAFLMFMKVNSGR